jgi:hypothetical protein
MITETLPLLYSLSIMKPLLCENKFLVNELISEYNFINYDLVNTYSLFYENNEYIGLITEDFKFNDKPFLISKNNNLINYKLENIEIFNKNKDNYLSSIKISKYNIILRFLENSEKIKNNFLIKRNFNYKIEIL